MLLYPSFRKKATPLLVFLLLLLPSCGVNLIAPYNQVLTAEVVQTAKQVDLFYLKMLDTTDANTRYYPLFADEYLNIEAELNSIFLRSKVQPLNKLSTRNFEIALSVWRGFKAEHKRRNMLPDGVIIYNEKYMNDLFYAILKGEEGKQP